MPLRPSLVLAAAAALSALAPPAPSLAAASGGAVTVSGAWSRPAAPGLATGVAYMTLRNGGTAPDRLLGASTPIAASASLHQSMTMGGMMSMQPVAGGLALPPGDAVALAPGGYHLMLEGLKHGLKTGERYPLTLHFAHARPFTVEVDVRPAPPR